MDEIKTPADLTKRPRFRESIDFSPSSGRKLARILQSYRFPRRDYLPCGISSCRTPHGSGYLVETSDGLETNIGNVCGAKHLGADFKQERSRFRAWERRHRNLQVIEGFQQQAREHQERIDQAVLRAKAFWHFTRQLDAPVRRALRAMAKERQERLDSDDRLTREDSRALYQSLQVPQKFTHWYHEHRPTVADLGLRFPGVSAMIYPFREVLVEELQKPMNDLLAMGMEEVEQLDDKRLDEWRQRIQAAPRRMREAENALEKAVALMAIDSSKFRFLPGVYPTEDD